MSVFSTCHKHCLCSAAMSARRSRCHSQRLDAGFSCFPHRRIYPTTQSMAPNQVRFHLSPRLWTAAGPCRGPPLAVQLPRRLILGLGRRGAAPLAIGRCHPPDPAGPRPSRRPAAASQSPATLTVTSPAPLNASPKVDSSCQRVTALGTKRSREPPEKSGIDNAVGHHRLCQNSRLLFNRMKLEIKKRINVFIHLKIASNNRFE